MCIVFIFYQQGCLLLGPMSHLRMDWVKLITHMIPLSDDLNRSYGGFMIHSVAHHSNSYWHLSLVPQIDCPA